MADDRQISMIKKGVEKWNNWRDENPKTRPDLTNADLRGALLDRADLHDANLAKADLTHAFLHEANLRKANLSGAILVGTNFCRAKLSGAELIGADLHRANLDRADLTSANLSNANLERTMLVRTTVSHALFTGCRVYGVSAWDLETTDVDDQSNLRITREDEPGQVTICNLEVAQFVYLMLHNPKIRDVIDTIGKKGVLIIGRFSEERLAILHAIRDKLQDQYELVPMMFESDPLSTKSLLETVSTLANLSRFVIADLTDAKSVLQELMVIVRELPSLPVQLILHESAEIPPMVETERLRANVLEPYFYSTKEKLIEDLANRVIGPAEDRAHEFESKLAEFREKRKTRKSN